VIALFELESYVPKNEVSALRDQCMSQTVPLFTQQLSLVLPASVAIAHRDPGHWSLVAGLLLELKPRDIAACVARPAMAFLYTKKNICLYRFNIHQIYLFNTCILLLMCLCERDQPSRRSTHSSTDVASAGNAL
jgi:hypothetical protein